MAPGHEYSAVGGGGKLKLKGSKVKDGRIEKKKKKKEKSESSAAAAAAAAAANEDATAVRRHYEDGEREGGGDEGRQSEGERVIYQTEAERRYEEQKKKRVHFPPIQISYLSGLLADLTTAQRASQARRRQDAQGTRRGAQSVSEQFDGAS